jgi:hypothetical protein
MFTTVISIVSDLARLGVNVTARQKEYLKWRTSRKGRKYFTKAEENAFYVALEKGAVDVIDVGIHEKQKRIDKLRRKLLSRLFSVLLLLVLTSGCVGLSRLVPKREVPVTSIETLTVEERSHVVSDMPIRSNGKVQVLEGEHHVVTKDFIRKFRQNQDTTLEALEQLNLYKTWLLPGVGIVAFFLGVLVMLGVVKLAGPKPQG